MDKIWLKSYPDGVPAEINPETFSSIAELFKNSVKLYADRPMVSNMGTTLTYRQMDAATNEFAAYLQSELKLKKGDRLAVMMPNLIQYFIAIFAALKIGVVVVNVNPLYTSHELTHQLNDSGAETILVVSMFAKTVETSLPQVNLKHIIVTDIGDCYPWLKSKAANLFVKHVKKMVPKYHLPGALSFKATLIKGKTLPLKEVELNSDDLAFLQYTGGTTGVSKGAMLTHRNILANVEQAFQYIKSFIELGNEVVVTALPLYHIFSLLANCLTFTRAGGENLLITNPRDMKLFMRELKRNRFTSITGVNTLFNSLNNNEAFKALDFSRLKVVLGGGMAVQQFVAETWHKITGAPILEAYGLTETSPAVTINPVTLKKFTGSIGLPLPSTEIKIVDDENNELPPGEVGELCVRGPQVMKGYWNRPDETEKVLSTNGWLITGDIARVDKDGYVYVVDRKKDMVGVSGFNVYPNEVEDVLTQHPNVIEAAVVGVKHPRTGEALKAFIVTNDASVKAEDIISFCREYLTAYKIPKLYEFRSELPKSNVGKILRRVLREEAENV